MHERTIWKTSPDGLTHWASVTGNELDGYEIRSDCGLVSEAGWEERLDDGTAVTCLRCRHTGGSNQPTTPTNGQATPARPRPGNVHDTDGPKSIGEILDEMNFPNRPASQRDAQRDSCSG